MKARRARSMQTQKSKGFFSALHDHFIPHAGNDHTPHAVRHEALLSYSVFMLLSKIALVSSTLLLPGTATLARAITPDTIIELTNNARSEANVRPLTTNPQLNTAAQQKAEDMLEKQYFSHVSPGGITPWHWFRENKYIYHYAGENLAVYFTEAEDVTAGWMASPSHRANMLDPRFADIGVGVSIGTFNDVPAIFVVELFGKLRNMETTAYGEPRVLAVQDEGAPSIAPTENGYTITLPDNGFQTVTAFYHGSATPLTKTGAQWSATLPAAEGDTSDIEAMVTEADGSTRRIPVAVVAPGGQIGALYGSNTVSSTSALGQIRTILALNTVFLPLLIIIVVALTIAMSLVAKMHHRRLSLATHATFVLALAIIVLFS